MKREDILHLADLARIELSDAEIDRFSKDFDDILTYVSAVKDLASQAPSEQKLGVVANVFREDENPHEAGIYTEDILALAPDRVGQYVRVKKVLDN